jgi:hypothetical protein
VPALMRCALVVAVAALAALPSCKPKVTPAQCDALIDRYAQLVVTEKLPDAGPETIKTEQERERGEARGDDSFKNCTSEVSRAEFDCAMRAPTADALEKCLE